MKIGWSCSYFFSQIGQCFGLRHDINLESYSVDNKSSLLFIRLQSKKQTAFKVNLYTSPNNLKNSYLYDLNIKDYFIKQLIKYLHSIY